MIPLVEVLTRTEEYLRQKGIGSARLEAELLLGHVLAMDRLNLYLAHDRPLTEDELTQLRPLLKQRGQRQPLSWVLKTRGFHQIDLQMAQGVFDPRPDTETLVEAALQLLDPHTDVIYVVDVGCGSGCVGLAIAAAHNGVRLYAVDLDPTAVATTRANVQKLGLEQRVAVLTGHLLTPIPTHRSIDWVVSNPPYIPTDDISKLEPEVATWEPKAALDGGPDGLDVYRELIPLAAKRVRRGILLEVGFDQADAVTSLLEQAGFGHFKTFNDLAGIRRVVTARTSDAPFLPNS
ncbi:MAG: peptide chain release factor N(5)-glutamine methyltransferase [Proteobacteria bacterium]|jgi:release factor glutamine methyltransferase|nr:peptide chain release factor N(5)-glutamine methyltransferase [Pseudomonadota bacterium]